MVLSPVLASRVVHKSNKCRTLAGGEEFLRVWGLMVRRAFKRRVRRRMFPGQRDRQSRRHRRSSRSTASCRAGGDGRYCERFHVVGNLSRIDDIRGLLTETHNEQDEIPAMETLQDHAATSSPYLAPQRCEVRWARRRNVRQMTIGDDSETDPGS